MNVEDMYNHCKDFDIVMYGHDRECAKINYHTIDEQLMLRNYKREIMDLPVKEVYAEGSRVCVRVKTDKMLFNIMKSFTD